MSPAGVHKKCLYKALVANRYEFGILKERRKKYDSRKHGVFEQNG